MSEKIPAITEIYDDITANHLHAGESYADARPTFEEFAALYELLVEHFYHNMSLIDAPVGGSRDEMLDVTSGDLKRSWESIATWRDVGEYIDAWIYDRLSSSEIERHFDSETE